MRRHIGFGLALLTTTACSVEAEQSPVEPGSTGAASTSAESTTDDIEASTSGDASTGAGVDDSSTSGVDACVDVDLMTDPEHCGVCMRSCLGGTCEAGACLPVAYPFSAESFDGALINRPFTVAADADGIYVHATGAQLGADGWYRFDRDGEDQAQIGPGWFMHTNIVPRGDQVYGYTAACCTSGQVSIYDKLTGETEVVGTSPPQIISTWLGEDMLLYGTEDRLRFTAPDLTGAASSFGAAEGRFPFVAGNTRFLFAAESIQGTWRVLGVDRSTFTLGDPLPMQVLFDEIDSVTGLVANEDALVVASDRLWRLDVDDGTTTDLTDPTDPTDPTDLGGTFHAPFVHEAQLWWVQDDTQLNTMPLAGGTIETKHVSDDPIHDVWVDAIGVVWVTGDDQTNEPGAVWQLAR